MFEDLGPLRDSIHDVIISDDVDIGCMIIRLTPMFPQQTVPGGKGVRGNGVGGDTSGVFMKGATRIIACGIVGSFIRKFILSFL